MTAVSFAITPWLRERVIQNALTIAHPDNH
jgi:hypothetical protein